MTTERLARVCGSESRTPLNTVDTWSSVGGACCSALRSAASCSADCEARVFRLRDHCSIASPDCTWLSRMGA